MDPFTGFSLMFDVERKKENLLKPSSEAVLLSLVLASLVIILDILLYNFLTDVGASVVYSENEVILLGFSGFFQIYGHAFIFIFLVLKQIIYTSIQNFKTSLPGEDPTPDPDLAFCVPESSFSSKYYGED